MKKGARVKYKFSTMQGIIKAVWAVTASVRFDDGYTHEVPKKQLKVIK